jgi:hypothetical protein
MKPRPVVNSADEKYPSMMEAARTFGLKACASISTAIQGTTCGLYRTAGGLQWAYADEPPDEWPAEPVKPEKPVKPSKPEREAPPVQEDQLLLTPMYPPEFDEVVWQPIPGLGNKYEINSQCVVRNAETQDTLEDQYYGQVSMVKIDGRLYNVVSLMLLAFIGPRPRSYNVKFRKGTSEGLNNVYYAPRKPRTKESE